MKKILLTIFIFLLAITTCYNNSKAESPRNAKSSIIIGGYKDYMPIGYSYDDDNNNYQTIFIAIKEKIRKDFSRPGVSMLLYDMSDSDSIEKDIRTGKIDIFIGGYNQTKKFENLHLLFPAILSNPVTFFVLPERVSSLKTAEDIVPLKGVRYAKEVFSDFVEGKLQKLKIETVDSTYDMFEKLFTREVDYILTGYYFGIIEAMKLGVRHQIATSKNPLWNIPVFIGISQISPHRDKLARYISSYYQDDNNVSEVKDNLRKILEQIENEYIGIVPPTFGLDKKTNENNETEATTVIEKNSDTNQNSEIKKENNSEAENNVSSN